MPRGRTPRARAPRVAWTALPVPLAGGMVALALLDAGLRVILVVALPALAVGAITPRLPCSIGSAAAVLLGVLSLGGGLIARDYLLVAAGVLALSGGLIRTWGVNRGRRRRRAWSNRLLTAVGTVLVGFLVVYPTMLTIDYLAKPRAAIHEGSLGLIHQRVSFPASDGVRLSGWYVPSHNGAAIVLVHGGGGDRQGVIHHARMLANAGYGVLLYDARGRGESEGHENAFGWEWNRDVHGAVSYLARRGVQRVGLLGISTGAEAVVAEAATDPRVGAVVSDGLQGRTAADASHLPFGDRISLQPTFAVAGIEIELASGQAQPTPLMELVHDVARSRPLLLIGTVSFEREFDRAYSRGTTAQFWQLPESGHTQGLRDHPYAYANRVLTLFGQALTATRLLQERGGRDVGRAVDPVDEERHLVDVAPVPVFAGLE